MGILALHSEEENQRNNKKIGVTLEKIFTIFINIFIIMNSILGFIWGFIVNTMYKEHHILYTLNSRLADCYILKYFLLSLVQTHHGLQGDFGRTNMYMVFRSNTTSRIQNEIVCDLLWT